MKKLRRYAVSFSVIADYTEIVWASEAKEAIEECLNGSETSGEITCVFYKVLEGTNYSVQDLSSKEVIEFNSEKKNIDDRQLSLFED